MIKISKPHIEIDGEFATLSANLTIDGITQKTYYRVQSEYGEYLCDERGDAFIVLCLNYAMKNGHDIVSEAPIGEYLYYHLDRYLIDALIAYNPSWHRTKIEATIDSTDLPNSKAVGTGISCGVDSCYSLAMEGDSKFTKHKLTHLLFNNVGSHGEGERGQRLFLSRQDAPKRIAKELGLKIIIGDSNVQDVVKQNHFNTHTYSSMFPVLCLQKLFSVYYYASSATKYHEFNLEFAKQRSSGAYEMLSLPLFSTDKLRIYSQGENKSRMEKIRTIVNYKPSYSYLNVCLQEGSNCNVCEKCVRTLLGLYAAGEVEKYERVFDISFFKTHLNWYFWEMMKQLAKGKHDYFEIYECLKREVPANLKFRYMLYLKPLVKMRALVSKNQALKKAITPI